jgi:hypothetical protein
MWFFRNFILLVPLHVVVFGLLYAVMVVWFGLAWLDGVQPPVFGWLLYPIELILNAIFFPGVPTHVRDNGSALIVLVVTLALFYVAYRLVRGAIFLFRVATGRRQ